MANWRNGGGSMTDHDVAMHGTKRGRNELLG